MGVRHGLEHDSNPNRTPVPRQTGQVFQYHVGRFSWLLGLGSARVRNEPVGVEVSDFVGMRSGSKNDSRNGSGRMIRAASGWCGFTTTRSTTPDSARSTANI